MQDEFATRGDTISRLHNTTKWNVQLVLYVSLSADRGAAWGAQRAAGGETDECKICFWFVEEMHDYILTAQYKEAELLPELKHLHHQAHSKSHILKRVCVMHFLLPQKLLYLKNIASPPQVLFKAFSRINSTQVMKRRLNRPWEAHFIQQRLPRTKWNLSAGEHEFVMLSTPWKTSVKISTAGSPPWPNFHGEAIEFP